MATKKNTKVEPYDILKEGPASFRDLQKTNNENYKKAVQLYGEDKFKPKYSYNFDDTSDYIYEGGKNSSLRDTATPLGESFWDKKSYSPDELNNLSDVRAEAQPWYAQISSGIAKGAVLAGTTFADGVVGTFAGIMNILSDAANGGHQGAFNAFIDNPFSRSMQEINDAVEELLPNYYTQEELESPWYTNIFTANFIGDKFLKNLGFTIGAAYASKVNAGMLSKLTGMNKIREAFKGAVATATGNTLNDADDIAKAYLRGDALMDGAKLTEDLSRAAKQMKTANTTLKQFGAITSAMGEGRIEAIQGSNEMFKLRMQQLDDYKEKRLQEAQAALLKEHPEMFALDENGNPFLIDERGKKLLSSKQNTIEKEYEEGVAKLNQDKARAANIIFSLNVPLLTASNIFQFGKFIAGGYTAGKLSNALVKGKIGEAVANKVPARVALAKAIGSPLMEAQEEMSQQWIQEIPGAKFGSELNNFYGAKIDPDSEKETIGWMKAIANGFMKSYGDSKQWEQGFIGALTGLMGAPSIHLRNKEGKFRPSITNDGELYTGINEYKELKKQAQDITNKLNNSDFKNYYQGIIRHNKLQNDMEAALSRGDKFDYKNAESSQILSDAIMFNKAGRLQELYDEIENAGNIRLEDVESIRNVTANKDGKSIFDDMQDQDVVEFIQRQAEGVRNILDRYVKTSNDLKTLYGENLNDDVLEEMTWMLDQVNDWEFRGSSILTSTRDILKNKAQELKDRFGVDINVVLNKYSDLETAFSKDKNLLADIQTIIDDKNQTVQEQRDRIDQRIKEATISRNTSGLKLGREIRHIRSKAKSRLAELTKLANIYSKAFESGDSSNRLNEIRRQYEEGLKSLQQDFNDYYLNEDGSPRIKDEDGLGEELFRHISKLQEATIESPEAQLLEDGVKHLEGLANRFIAQQGLIESGQWAKNRETQARARQAEESASLFSQIVALQDALKDEHNQLVDPLSTQKILENITDLAKIIAARTKFINDYNSLSKNPEMFTDNAVKQAKEIVKHYQEEIVNKKIEDIKDVKTLKELREKIADLEDEEVDMLASKIEKGDNAKLKSLVGEHKKLKNARNIMDTILDEETATPESISAANIIYDALDTANSYNEALTIIKEALDDAVIPKGVKDKVNELIEKYVEIQKAKEAAEKDNRTPKKKIKDNKENQDSKEETKEGTPNEKEDDTSKEEEPSKPKKKKRFALESLPDEPGTDTMQREEAEGGGKLEVNPEDTPEEATKEPIEESANSGNSEAFEDTITSDNLSNYIETRTDRELETIANTVFTSTTALEKALGINLGEGLPRMKSTLETIQNAAKDEMDARKEARKKEEKKAEETKKKEEIKIKPKKKVKIADSSEDDSKTPASPVDIVQDLNDEELKQIAEGEVELEGVSDKEQKDFEKLAKSELESRTLPATGESSDEAGSSSENNGGYSSNNSMRSWRVAQYEFKSLSDRKRRKAVVWDSPMVRALQKLGAFDFVDNGSLGILFNENPEIPIHFILSNKEEFKGTPLLAIEVTKEVKDAVNPINPITIKDSEGKEHQYQIVGTLYHNNSDASKDSYRTVTRRLNDELLDDSGNLNAPYKVSEQSHTQVRHLYSGRFVKSDEHSDVKFRSLKDIMKGEKPYFYIYYNSTQNFTTVPKTEAIVPLNTNNQNPREGSVWLATREADGRFYLKALKVARLDSYDLEAHKDAPIVKKIKECLQDICNPELSDSKRGLAKYDLEKILHFPKNHRILFNGDSVSIYGYENNIGEDLDPEEKAEELLSVLQSEELSLRFNLNPSEMTEDAYIQDILDSDILTTDILYPHNVNASFDVYPVDNNGNPLVSEGAESTGHTGNLGINTDLSYATIIHNGVEYSIDDDGKVYNEKGEMLKNQDDIDEIKFNQQIRDGEVNPEEGTNLYIGYHQDGSPFGVINYRTISEERMNEILDKAKKKAEKEKSENALDDAGNKSSSSSGKSRSAIEWLLSSDEDEAELADTEENIESQGKDSQDDDDEYEERSIFGGNNVTLERSEDDIEDDTDDEYEERSIFGQEDEDANTSDDSNDSDDEYEERTIFPEEEKPVKKGPAESSNTSTARTKIGPVIDDHTLGRKWDEPLKIPPFEAMAKKGRKALRELGFKSVTEVENFIIAHQESFPKLDTITTQEEFDTVVDNIRNKCYK